MTLPKTKEILKRLYDKYGDELRSAKLDIKPDYSGIGIGISSGMGYSYYGIDDCDRDFIYSAISQLCACVNDAFGPISFDIENHYIIESKAIKELDSVKDLIYKNIIRIKGIQKKYEGKDHSEYPIHVCLSNHEQVYDILEEIYNSDEFKEFKNPGQIEWLIKENLDLKFNDYWRIKKRKYKIHLVAFIPFLIFAGWIIINKDNQALSASGKTSVILIGGLLTIVFNLFFNNHNSFKDSWKLLTKSTRKVLKAKEKEIFLKSIK